MYIYNLSGFQWWCKQRRNYSFIAIAFIIFFLIIFCSGFSSSWKTNEVSISTIDKGAMGILVLMSIVFVAMILSLLRAILRNMRIKVNECVYGTIIDFYIKHYVRFGKRYRRFYIVVDINGKQMEAQCLAKTYRKAQKDQQVIVFSVKGEKHLYCVHPEM